MKLSPDSQALEDFIDNYNVKHFKLSPISTSVIKNIFELLKTANKNNIKYIKEYFPDTAINNNADLDDSLQEIQNDIQVKYNKQFNFEFQIGDRHFYIHMFYPNNSIKSECIFTCKKYLLYIYCWLFIANSLAKNKYSKKLTINITFTNHKKQKPPKTQIFNSVHVNTAYTYACREETNINIFRKEEWFKVLIHETFHSMGLDFVCMDNSLIEEKIGELFPVKKYDIRVYETYCEMWAEIINILFVSFFRSRRKDFNYIIKKMNKMLAYEAYFSMFQMNKILENYEMTYSDLLTNRKIYKENTYILSYYILKSIFMCFLNVFIEWCHTYNKDIEFNKTETVLREFGLLIERLYKNPVFLQNVERIKKVKSSEKFVNDTMRMSLYEMG
tara:strand:+ start:2908 stop:4068 length:1161 start_codon:yes stop_codon:yes gene_type:complete